MKTRLRFLLSSVLTVAVLLGMVAWSTTRPSAQESDEANRVRGLNGQLMQLLAQWEEAGPNRAGGLRAQAAAILESRLTTLASLIEQNPGEALRLAFSADITADLDAAFPGAARQLEVRGIWEGPIEYVVEDAVDFRSHRNLRTMTLGGETITIHFAGAEPPGLKNGDTLRVQGIRAGSQVAADSGVIVGADNANGRGGKTTPPPCSTFGPQSTIVLLVTMPGASAPPAEITHAALREVFFNSSGSVESLTDYWRENSYGATTAYGDVAPGTSGGWYTLDRVYTEDEASQIRTAAIAAADADVDFTQYKRIFIVMNGATSTGGTWAGRGTIGCGLLTSQDGNFNASTSWLKPSPMTTHLRGVHLAAHEGGHNLGLHHSQSREFDTEALGAPGASGVVDEYNDIFANMGRGFGHYAAPHKFKLGWLSTQVLTVTGSGSHVVQPTELPGTLQALRIRRGTDNASWLWIEFRQPVGLYDTKLVSPFVWGNQIVYLDDAESHVYSGGLVHYEDAATGGQTHLLDLTPYSRSGSTSPLIADDWFDPALNGTWQDPYTGVSIGTSNPTAGGLSVNVSYGSGPCVEANPTVSIAPSNPGAKRGQTVSFSVTVTNNDTLPCTGKTFTMTSSLPPNWTTTFSAGALTLAAGDSATVTMTKTVPAGASYATYAVDAVATSGSFAGAGTANVTVKPGK